MPYTNIPPELQDKMDSCVQQVRDEGNDEQAAIAICYATVVEGKSMAPATAAPMPSDCKRFTIWQ